MKHLESKIQKEIVRYFRYAYPKSLIYAIPNGGKRNVIEASRLKSEGVLAGVSDLHVIHDGAIYFIEVKTDKGKQSESQLDFQNKVESQGFKYFIVKNVDDFIKIFDNIK